MHKKSKTEATFAASVASFKLTPALQPGGIPRVTTAAKEVYTVVETCPEGSVTTLVKIEGSGEMVGIAEALKVVCVPKMALYVLVARPDVTIAPTEAGMEVFIV